MLSPSVPNETPKQRMQRKKREEADKQAALMN